MTQSLLEKDNKNEKNLRVINITSNASKRDLLESLDKEARKLRINLRIFCGDILEKALMEKDKYESPLKNPMLDGGQHITCVVSAEAKDELGKWAKSRKRAQGGHCAFILEKWIEMRSGS